MNLCLRNCRVVGCLIGCQQQKQKDVHNEAAGRNQMMWNIILPVCICALRCGGFFLHTSK